MSGLVTFNVGGVRYTTTRATISAHPDTMLAMVLRHNENDEIFIDHDGEMFRFILFWYRSGTLALHTDVGVSQEIWQAYVDYFALPRLQQSTYCPSSENEKVMEVLDKVIASARYKLDTEKKGRVIIFAKAMCEMLTLYPGKSVYTFTESQTPLEIFEPNRWLEILKSRQWAVRHQDEWIDFARSKGIEMTFRVRENQVSITIKLLRGFICWLWSYLFMVKRSHA